MPLAPAIALAAPFATCARPFSLHAYKWKFICPTRRGAVRCRRASTPSSSQSAALILHFNYTNPRPNRRGFFNAHAVLKSVVGCSPRSCGNTGLVDTEWPRPFGIRGHRGQGRVGRSPNTLAGLKPRAILFGLQAGI